MKMMMLTHTRHTFAAFVGVILMGVALPIGLAAACGFPFVAVATFLGGIFLAAGELGITFCLLAGDGDAGDAASTLAGGENPPKVLEFFRFRSSG
jgi:hypothetical protein